MFGDNELICTAINERRVIEFTYKHARRRIEPYMLGVSLKDNLALSGWQISGGSAVDWREFLVDTLSGLRVTDERFDGQRRGYNPHDPAMKSVRCRV